jgi:hypothetical protein
MITIQEAHRYISIVDAGLAKPIKCGNDPEHTDLVTGVTDENEVFFYCLGCTYKIHPGYKMVRYIKFVLENFSIKN